MCKIRSINMRVPISWVFFLYKSTIFCLLCCSFSLFLSLCFCPRGTVLSSLHEISLYMTWYLFCGAALYLSFSLFPSFYLNFYLFSFDSSCSPPYITLLGVLPQRHTQNIILLNGFSALLIHESTYTHTHTSKTYKLFSAYWSSSTSPFIWAKNRSQRTQKQNNDIIGPRYVCVCVSVYDNKKGNYEIEAQQPTRQLIGICYCCCCCIMIYGKEEGEGREF